MHFDPRIHRIVNVSMMVVLLLLTSIIFSMLGGCQTTIAAPPAPPAKLTDISDLIPKSKCSLYGWGNRGRAPAGYLKGVALTYARSACQLQAPHVAPVAQPKTGVDSKDALSWYNSNFAKLGMVNEGGLPTLRHAYTLLIGLGMRESSGRHCCGRDASASNVSSESAEAGVFQTSYNARGFHPELSKLFTRYMGSSKGCLLEVFSESVSCSSEDLKTWGTGANGMAFQKLEKNCPAFATEFAAIMLRVSGGTAGHYGPLRKKAAEIRPECDELLQQVDAKLSPAMCAELLK